MRYLLNLPLAAAGLFQLWFAYLVLMPAPWPGWSDGPSRGAMVLVILEPVLLGWLLLAIAIAGAVFTGAFDWLPVRRRWLRAVLVLAATVLIGALAVPCLFTAIGASAAVAQAGEGTRAPPLAFSATIVATIVPLILIGWLAWLVDAPAQLRHAAAPRWAGAAGLVLTVVTGGILGAEALSDEIRISRETARRYQQWIDEDKARLDAGFAKVGDADPLIAWSAYTSEFAAKDMQQAALRRLATRPTLEADLSAALSSADSDLSDFAFLLVGRVEFKPSPALAGPLRVAMSRIAGKIGTVREPGSGNDYDTYLDLFFGERLAAALGIARKMADSANVDLSPSLHELQSAVLAAYPKSKSAKTYPGEVAAAETQITAALAARPKPTGR